jgi:hypothetical protein
MKRNKQTPREMAQKALFQRILLASSHHNQIHNQDSKPRNFGKKSNSLLVPTSTQIVKPETVREFATADIRNDDLTHFLPL